MLSAINNRNWYQSEFIVDASVNSDSQESHTTVPTVDHIEETFEETPKKLLADTSHGTGLNYKELKARGVEAYIPANNYIDKADNPARRDDPTHPVPESDWDRLPRTPQSKKLDRSVFVYDASLDCYYCPMGRKLTYGWRFNQARKWGILKCKSYLCDSCADCPLAAECLKGKSKQRTVTHDEFEQVRQEVLARMRSPEGKEIYSHRKWLCETPFGVIKTRMKLRQFLLRGLKKVETEWLWACTSFNLSKLISELVRMRAKYAMALA